MKLVDAEQPAADNQHKTVLPEDGSRSVMRRQLSGTPPFHSDSAGATARRIAIFLPSLIGGGAERVMVTLANCLARRGLTVDLVAARLGGKYGAYLKDVSPAVNVVDLKASRLVFCLPALVGYFRHTPPDICLSAINQANVLAIVARRLAGKRFRLAVSERNSLANELQGRTLRNRVLPWLMRRTYPFADAIIAVTKGVGDELVSIAGLDRRNVITIHNPVPVDHIRRLAAEPTSEIGEYPGPLIIGAGRLEAQKDFPTLIRAFALLRAQRPCRLVILGEGSRRPELEALVAELDLSSDVSLPGFAANPYSWMKRADLFVLSSAWEGFANVLAEAMACGTTVISTDCPSGPTEILEDGKWGRLVPVGDAGAMAAAMAAALDDRSPPDVVQRAAVFDLNTAADAYLRALRGEHYASV